MVTRSAPPANASASGLVEVASTCRVCCRAVSRYSCPRCRTPYCSLPCYRSHGASCTEAFYQQQVEGALKKLSASDKQKIAIQNILTQHEEEQRQQEEENDEELTIERLQNLALSDRLDIEHLSARQKSEFLRAAADGSLGGFIDHYRPWWITPASVDVREIAADFSHWRQYIPRPQLVSEAKFSTIANHERKPFFNKFSPLLVASVFDAFETLLSYALLLRFYNGDWSWSFVDAAEELLDLTPALCNRHQCARDVKHAYQEVSQALSQCQLTSSDSLSTLIALVDSGNILFLEDGFLSTFVEVEKLLTKSRSKRAKVAAKKVALFASLAQSINRQRQFELATSSAALFQELCQEREIDDEIQQQRTNNHLFGDTKC